MFDAQARDAAGPAARPLLPMVGHTRDISETGLAIVVTSDSPGSQRDEIIGRELRIVLDLPAGLTHLRATVVRAQPLAAEESEKGYMIGVRITQMNDKDWVHMVRYIVKLRQRT
jgi:c-di-GMP-binding flagellar brake protein YcgR